MERWTDDYYVGYRLEGETPEVREIQRLHWLLNFLLIVMLGLFGYLAWILGTVVSQRDGARDAAEFLAAQVDSLRAHPTFSEERCPVVGILPARDGARMVYALCQRED